MLHRININNRKKGILSALLMVAATVVTLSPSAFAGEWRVTPIRVFFEHGARSGIVNVQNDSDTPLTFKVKAVEWSQDAAGKDVYADTNDLVFFPKVLTVPARDERVVRVGLKGGAGAREKTFRLFVEEDTKQRAEAKHEGATVAVNVRFAIPIFATPVKEIATAKVGEVSLSKGVFAAAVQNTGNTHFRITSLDVHAKDAKGADVFSKKIDGWYLLAGATRNYTFEIPATDCLRAETIEMVGETDNGIILKSAIAVDKKACKP